MSEQTIKPCPFCGGKDIYIEGGETYRWVRKVCADCGASSGDVRVGQDLIESWNTRTESKVLSVEDILECLPPDIAINPSFNREQVAQRIKKAMEAKNE